ncbi:MAG: hypothetical protein ACI83W_002693 [Marinoscillum sp.]|jgi:hypothetical protein
MIPDEHLSLFFTEDLYVLNEELSTTKPVEQVEATVEEPKEELVKKVEPTPEIPEVKITVAELAIWTPPLTEEDRVLLTKILKAIKQEMSDALVMQGINSYSPHYKKIICFGYQKELELKTGKNTLLYSLDQRGEQTILISDEPAALHQDVSKKTQLWNALKLMFPDVAG